MLKPIKQLPTFAWRTYRGGAMIKDYLGITPAADTFYPEDWISSFVEAKNKNYVENEGITRILYDGEEKLITDVVTDEYFGEGRSDSGVLIKFLDAAERLGIQVHPTKEYAKELFNSSYGKTECWHILGTRNMGEPAVIYLGFKEYVTKELWKELFEKQDIKGMLDAMHRFEVEKGDTILVTGGTPHAIGAGCFLLEIQEPSDYTMRTEKVTVAGDALTPMQIHYGVGEEKMLDCFDYTPKSREEIEKSFFLKPGKSEINGVTSLVTYDDTPCFALEQIKCNELTIEKPHFVTVIATKCGGSIKYDDGEIELNRGDKFFVPANTGVTLNNAEALICYPPKKHR